MKKKKPVKSKAHVKKSLIPRKWLRGKIDRGTIFIVVIVISLMFLGYIFVGGTIPETIPKPRAEGIMSVNLTEKYPPEQGLQMHTFQGVTITPYPTLPPAAPQPQTTTISEVECGSAIVGTAKPELIWAYRVAATAASANNQSIQVFYSGPDAIPAGTTAMTQRPTQHLASPPANAANRDANGFPISPAIFITDITANAADTSGDARSGGIPQFPSDIYGAWKTEGGFSPPVANGQNLGAGADLWPPANGPAGGPRNSDWTAQMNWNLGNMRTKTGAAVVAGNKYRAQIVLHEGARNEEIAQLCTIFTAPGGTAPAPGGTNISPAPGQTAGTCGGSANTPNAPITGYTIKKCEDFTNGFGAFSGYSGGGDGTVVGRGRVAGQCTAANGILTLTQNADGATCGGSMSSFSQKYGYWETKMKAYTTGTSGSAPHPVLITWPDAENWPVGGENDYLETDIGDTEVGVFLHCPTNAGGNCFHASKALDMAQWHVYGFEWTPTSMTGYIDGQLWYTTSGINPAGAMHQTIQLDNLTGKTPVKSGKMEVDWVHMYSK
jgi:hypothetical protein